MACERSQAGRPGGGDPGAQGTRNTDAILAFVQRLSATLLARRRAQSSPTTTSTARVAAKSVRSRVRPAYEMTFTGASLVTTWQLASDLSVSGTTLSGLVMSWSCAACQETSAPGAATFPDEEAEGLPLCSSRRLNQPATNAASHRDSLHRMRKRSAGGVLTWSGYEWGEVRELARWSTESIRGVHMSEPLSLS